MDVFVEMVRFGSVRFFKVFLRTENRTISPVHRLWRTLNRTVGSVRDGPVLVLRASEPRTGPNMFFFFFSPTCILQHMQLGTVVAMCTYTLRSCETHHLSMCLNAMVPQRFGYRAHSSILLYVLLVRLHHFNDSINSLFRYLALNFGNVDNIQYNM